MNQRERNKAYILSSIRRIDVLINANGANNESSYEVLFDGRPFIGVCHTEDYSSAWVQIDNRTRCYLFDDVEYDGVDDLANFSPANLEKEMHNLFKVLKIIEW